MYCPNCGVEIHAKGSFCAKCRKNVAYLTQSEEKPTAPVADEGEVLENEATPSAETVIVPVQKKGFYCNYCGTFVFPEDNYCYQCGKETRKNYYHASSLKKSSFFSFGKNA